MENEKELKENEVVEETLTTESEKNIEEVEATTATGDENTGDIEEKKEEEAPVAPRKNEPPKKERSERRGKHVVSRILNIVLWIVLLAWMALVIVDYIHVRNEETPQFCWFNEKTTSYSDGTVTECTGLGYKVINYNRTSFQAVEFGPFWITDRTAEGNE